MWLPNVNDLSQIKIKTQNIFQNVKIQINIFIEWNKWVLSAVEASALNQYSILVSEMLHHYIVCVRSFRIMDLMLFQHFPGIPITDPKYFSQMSVQELAHILRSDNETPMPMLQERHQVWTS